MIAPDATSFARDIVRLPPLPEPRGPVTRWLFRRLLGRPVSADVPVALGDPLTDDDLHAALHCLYELDYRGFAGVAPGSVRDPLVLALRHRIEDHLLDAVRADTADAGFARWAELARTAGPGAAVDAMVADFDGPSLSRHLAEHGTRDELLEFMVHRSPYQLKEADPHTMGLARMAPGPRKTAFVEIQFDEYGLGAPGAAHAELYAAALAAAGLDPRYGRYVDELPGTTLATGNLLSLFASRRELLAPLVGHLALFEMTSVEPMTRYVAAVRRLGLPAEVATFFEVHVDADAHHGRLARDVLLGDDGEADLDAVDMVWGAFALLRVEDRFARALLDAWAQGRSARRRTDG